MYVKTNPATDGVVDRYTAVVITANDYYHFGMLMPGRKYSADGSYRYGFNGKENDNEVKGEGNQQDYGMRIYDPRLGRFLSVDPLTAEYPWFTPYQYAGNMPVWAVDIDGLEGDQKPNGNEKKEEEKDVNRSKAIEQAVKFLDDKMLGGEGAHQKRLALLSSAVTNQMKELSALRSVRAKMTDELFDTNIDRDPIETVGLLESMKDFDAKIAEKEKAVSFLIRQIYIAGHDGKNIDNYGKLVQDELKLLQYTTGHALTAITLLPTGGTSGLYSIGSNFLSKNRILGQYKRKFTNWLFSARGGYGLFGKDATIGGFEIGMFYRNPSAGFGAGTFFSLKSRRAGGFILRWDYGPVHKTLRWGVHSTFRYNIFGKTFGSTKQFPWYAPYTFWKYPNK